MTMLKPETIKKLGLILKEEYGMALSKKELEEAANNLVGYFNLLTKISSGHKVRKSSSRTSCNTLEQKG